MKIEGKKKSKLNSNIKTKNKKKNVLPHTCNENVFILLIISYIRVNSYLQAEKLNG